MRQSSKGLIPRPGPGRLDEAGILETFAHRMMYSVAKDEFTASDFDVYQALAYAVRDRLMERWFRTQNAYYRADAKRVYYLSLEFLMGRALLNNIVNLGARDAYREAMAGLGYDLDRAAGGGVGRRARQRRPGPAGRLLPGLGGHAGAAVLRLRHPLRVRHLPAAASRTATRSRLPTTGCATATPGRSRGPACSARSTSTGRAETRRDAQGGCSVRLGGHPGGLGHGLRHADRWATATTP